MFCSNCGEKLGNNETTCPKCGAETARARAERSYHAAQSKDSFKIIDVTKNFAEEDRAQNRGMAILSYLPLLFLIPVLTAKESPFARFHASQGTMLSIIHIGILTLGFLFGFLGKIFIVGLIFKTIYRILLLIIFVIRVYMIIQCLQDKSKQLPYIGSAGLYE